MNLETKTQEKEAKRSRFRQALVMIGAALCGFIVCLVSLKVGPWKEATPLQPNVTPETETVAVSREATPAERLEPFDMINVERAETHFLNEAYAEAYSVFAALPQDQITPEIRYLTAVSLEFANQHEEAHLAYEAIASKTADFGLAVASRIGRIRTWLAQEEFLAAKAAALELIMSTGSNEEVLAAGYHLLAFAATLEAYPHNEDLMGDGIRVIRHRARPDTLRELPSRINAIPTDTDAPAAQPNSIELLDRLGDLPSEVHVSCRFDNANAKQLLEAFSQAANIPIDVGQDALVMLERARLTADCKDIDGATLLDALLHPRRLHWTPAENGIRIRFERDVPRSEIVKSRHQQAQRVSLSSITLHPDHKLYEQTFLNLGNIAFWEKQYREAAVYYQEMALRGASSTAAKSAWFNLGKVHWQLNERDACREAYLNAVDRSSGDSIEAIGYYLIGLLDIEAHRPLEAARNFGRVLSIGKDDRVKTRAVLDMAAAHLMADNPKAANTVLTHYRQLIRTDSVRPQAVFLNSLARFQAAANTQQRINEGQELVMSIAHVEPRQFDRSVGFFLLGSALQELGYDDQAEQAYATSISTSDCELRCRMIFEMAKIAVGNSRFTRAREHLGLLIESELAPWQRRAKLQLAKIELEQGNYDECLKQCLAILPQCVSQTEKMSVLEVSGRAFEQKNNHYQAALCFAGMMPSEGYELLQTTASESSELDTSVVPVPTSPR